MHRHSLELQTFRVLPPGPPVAGFWNCRRTVGECALLLHNNYMPKITDPNITNRTDTAAAMNISMTTLDNWVRRGCPVISRDGRGRNAKFSLVAVRQWRVKDLQRSYPAHVAEEMARLGREHANALRQRVEGAAAHFLWWSFSHGGPILFEDLHKQEGLTELEAKRYVCFFWLYWIHLFEAWLTGDAYNKNLEQCIGSNLDDEMRTISCGRYKWHSMPPSNFDIDRDTPRPRIVEEYGNDLRKARTRREGAPDDSESIG